MTLTPSPGREAPSLRDRATRGTIVAFASQALSFVINLGVVVMLARLLAPEDFGLFGIALAITRALEFAKQGGMVVPVIQSETITAEQRSALFWFNAALGASLTLVVAAAAPLVGRVYADARLAPLIAALALTFLSGGLSAQHVALLRRDMRFTALASCELTALLCAGGVAAWAARSGAGSWALIGFQLSRELLQALFVVVAARWRPSWPKRGAGVGTLLRSGGIMMVFDALGYLNFKSDDLIVGWRLGPAMLGFYGKAYEFLLLPMNQITAPLSNVVHSSLSRLQGEPARYRAFLSRALLLASGLGLPATAFLYANAHPVIVQILGEPWEPAVPIYRALAPAAASLSVTCSVGWIFLSLGRARRQLSWSVLTTLITVVAFLLGASWGAVGVAWAFSITRVILLVPTLAFTCSGTAVSWVDLLGTAARPALASLVAMTASLVADALDPAGAWTLPRNMLVFAAAYVLCWALMPTGRALMLEGLTLARRRSQHV